MNLQKIDVMSFVNEHDEMTIKTINNLTISFIKTCIFDHK